MQTLYTLATTSVGDAEEQKKAGSKLLDEKIARSLDLFIVSIIYTLRIAQYAEKDASQRAAKYLPTQEDLNVNTKIAGNEFLWRVMNNESFHAKLNEPSITQYIDEDWIKKVYQELTKTEEYKEYISVNAREPKAEVGILRFIWETLIADNEDLFEFFSDELPGWEDDYEMTEMLMSNFFKSSSKINFLNLISKEKNDYAHNLLHTAIDKETYCSELIQPKLINWDSDRVALIDMILLRMGVCELLYFPSIPTKVTINEYIEIAKYYSTPQSGQFINGVLDNILKDLLQENKIHKEERKLK